MSTEAPRQVDDALIVARRVSAHVGCECGQDQLVVVLEADGSKLSKCLDDREAQ